MTLQPVSSVDFFEKNVLTSIHVFIYNILEFVIQRFLAVVF